jgi:hypothetical protein
MFWRRQQFDISSSHSVAATTADGDAHPEVNPSGDKITLYDFELGRYPGPDRLR